MYYYVYHKRLGKINQNNNEKIEFEDDNNNNDQEWSDADEYEQKYQIENTLNIDNNEQNKKTWKCINCGMVNSLVKIKMYLFVLSSITPNPLSTRYIGYTRF